MSISTFSFAVAIPDGLAVRVIGPTFTIHCSHCGQPYEGENGPAWFTADNLPKLADYEISENGWIVNLDGLHSDTVGDRKLVCPACAEAGWCEICDEPIRAWQPTTDAADLGVVHEGCVDKAASHD